MRTGDPDDAGFTLIELMVVVLIIGILLAIAVPTFLSVRERSSTRAAQANAMNAHTEAAVYFTEHSVYTDDIAEMKAVDPSMLYTNVLADATDAVVYLGLIDTYAVHDTLLIATRSRTGSCYFVRVVTGQPDPRYSHSDDCTVPPAATFTTSW